MRGLTLVAITEFAFILEANLIINKLNARAIRSAPTYYSKSTQKANRAGLVPALSPPGTLLPPSNLQFDTKTTLSPFASLYLILIFYLVYLLTLRFADNQS